METTRSLPLVISGHVVNAPRPNCSSPTSSKLENRQERSHTQQSSPHVTPYQCPQSPPARTRAPDLCFSPSMCDQRQTCPRLGCSCVPHMQALAGPMGTACRPGTLSAHSLLCDPSDSSPDSTSPMALERPSGGSDLRTTLPAPTPFAGPTFPCTPSICHLPGSPSNTDPYCDFQTH